MQVQSDGGWGWTSKKAFLFNCLVPELAQLGDGQRCLSLHVDKMDFSQHGDPRESDLLRGSWLSPEQAF